MSMLKLDRPWLACLHVTADHFLDVITPSMSESTEDLAKKEEQLIKAFRHPEVDIMQGG